MFDAQHQARVVIVGGGIAGVEAVLALNDLAGSRAAITLISDGPDLLMKPLTIEEPFSGQPADSYALAPLLEGIDGKLVLGKARSVETDERLVVLEDGSKIPYDRLLVCLGARPTDPFSNATTISPSRPMPIAELIGRAAAHSSRTISVVIPAGTTWPLPAYEFALQAAQRCKQMGVYGLLVELITPEERPLEIFGPTASAEVAAVLAARGVRLRANTRLEELHDGELYCHPGNKVLETGVVITMPVLVGPNLHGLPADDGGYLPTDLHGKVKGAESVWAAGDGTAYPVKQGGLATEQADAAAADIAHSIGADVERDPFDPVLHGQLITGDESVHLEHALADGDSDSRVSADYLWWPPTKVFGRYLPGFIAHESAIDAPTPPREPLQVEYAFDPDRVDAPVLQGKMTRD